MEDLENESTSYVIVREFLSNLKEKFESKNNEMMKMAELKKVK